MCRHDKLILCGACTGTVSHTSYPSGDCAKSSKDLRDEVRRLTCLGGLAIMAAWKEGQDKVKEVLENYRNELFCLVAHALGGRPPTGKTRLHLLKKSGKIDILSADSPADLYRKLKFPPYVRCPIFYFTDKTTPIACAQHLRYNSSLL